ncbi:hypothetical protein [Hymenobacter arizonensis]|uniref:Uncharacterized protein n=1 Tax=Hymenobacter arizonensis TaxID=1227077 RepID=A0A1I5TUX7_HYMAR|nr:hypothetical protein [Hymenobacter arizonensis]SFP86819.1 hypothetical protein SAMN04515668_0615 [Hymenobacter arizonensis]
MYKIIFTLLGLFLTLGSFSAHAQMADRMSEHPAFSTASISKAAGDDALIMTREMTNRLHLNEGQFLHLLPLNRTRLVGLKQINREYRNDPATRTAKIAELEAQYEEACSRVLTPSQLSQLQHDNDHSATAPGPGLG